MATTEFYPMARSDAGQNASKQPGIPDSTSLMHMIFRYLDQDSPTSPHNPSQDEPTLPRVKIWQENLGDFESPILGTKLDKFVDSASVTTRSPTGSVFSSLSSSGMRAPSTSASSISSEEGATSKDVSQTENQPARVNSASNSIRSKASEPCTPMLANITDVTELMPEFMPEFITPPQTPINKGRSVAEHARTRSYPSSKAVNQGPVHATNISTMEVARISPRNTLSPSSRPASMNHILNLKVDTSNLARPRPNCLVIRDPNIKTKYSNPPSRKAPLIPAFPEAEFSKPVPPALHVGSLNENTLKGTEIPSPTPRRRSLVLSGLSKRLRKGSQTPTFSPDQNSIEIPSPSRRLLGELERHTLEWNRLSAFEMSTEIEPTSRVEEKVRKTRDTPDALKVGRTAMKKLEKIEEVLPLPLGKMGKQGRASESGFKKQFFAGKKGLQMRMNRRYMATGMMEWDIDNGEGKRLIRCQQKVHSINGRKDFLDSEGHELFTFQKRIGSTRVAESANGTTLFSIRNAALSTIPRWTIYIPATATSSATEWIARGDKDMRSVLVTWGEYEVGRITAVSQKAVGKHTYNITLARETNFCMIAALVTVLDDLRVDEMY